MLVTRHLEALYDIPTVLDAFRQIQLTYPAASLWIAGTGSEGQRLRDLVRDWKLEHVRFLGHVEHSSLPAIYDQCDFLLNASRIDNFPGSLMEASAAGLVIVTTKAGGIPFVYEDGTTALLVEIGDAQALGMAVKRVLEDPMLGQRLVKGSLALCRRYQWENIREPLYKLYGQPFAATVMASTQSSGAKPLTAPGA